MLRPLAVLGAVLVTAIAVVGGCTGDDSPDEGNGPAGSGASTAASPVTTEVAVGRVTGRLGQQKLRALEAEVAAVVDAYLDNAYLGDFPRASFDEAYGAFTQDARADAERDADLLSNAAIGDRIEVATATKRRATLDVLAVEGKARGVTARFTLDFETAGELERAERVKGYLLLAREGEGWKVFGYDVTRSEIA